MEPGRPSCTHSAWIDAFRPGNVIARREQLDEFALVTFANKIPRAFPINSVYNLSDEVRFEIIKSKCRSNVAHCAKLFPSDEICLIIFTLKWR